MLRRDGSSSDFIDIELGEFSPITQSTIPDWTQESPSQTDLESGDQSRDIMLSSQQNEFDGLFALCPNEILLAIFKHLSIENLISLSQTSKHFQTVIKDYIKKNRQLELPGYRIRFFRQRQFDLNDEIDDLSISKIKLKTVLGLVTIGTLLTAMSSRLLQSSYDSRNTATRDEKVIVTILFVVSIAILLSGVISMIYNVKLCRDMDSANRQIDKLEDNIRYEDSTLRQSRMLKLL